MDALKQAEKINREVSKGRSRKYYRFRAAPYYGGIATADCVGCCLICIFCWSWKIVTKSGSAGKIYSPEFVADKLVKIARKNKFHQMRISGNEPTLNREHLLNLLAAVPSHYHFILETNGILLGSDRSYCHDLARFSNLHVRVSFKGCNGAEFEHLTGMEANGFNLQLFALENLLDEGVSCHPAVVSYFSKPATIKSLRLNLESIDPSFRFFENEQLILYPAIEERLRRFKFIE
jgi:uncharacterized Fe-S cluster-containing radical SAM superfamily protein